MKPLIVYTHPGVIAADFMKPLWAEWFDVEPWDPQRTYSKHNIFWWAFDDFPVPQNWPGCVVKENFDVAVEVVTHQHNNCLMLSSPDWIWIYSSLWFKYLGHDNFTVDRSGDRLFLLLMHLAKPWRTQLYNATAQYKDSALISYVAKGITIPGDQTQNLTTWSQHFASDWYNSTQFSVVSESVVQKSLFISEKSYKPIAYGHPFVIWGTPGTLQHLRTQGFETFDHVIRETYDLEVSPARRLDQIIQVISELYTQWQKEKALFTDWESQQRLAHNRELFYNTTTIKNKLYTGVIEPIMEFINA